MEVYQCFADNWPLVIPCMALGFGAAVVMDWWMSNDR